MTRILLVEDEENYRVPLAFSLRRDGFDVVQAADGVAAVEAFEAAGGAGGGAIDLVLLDLMLPGLSGEEVLPKLRGIPVIIMSAKASVDSKVELLLGGAADYVTKPFNPLELVARVKSQLRRYTKLGNLPAEDSQVYRTGGLMVDDDRKEVTVDGEPVALTPIEYNILRLLMTHPGQVFSSAQIYEQVWNDPAYGSENTVAVHIRHLREKIEIDPADPRYLKVVWGLGYKMEKGGL